jgi:hypothetical protein
MTYTQVWNPMNNQPHDSMIQRDEDGAFIPFDPDNVDYQDYLAWLDEGNAPNEPPAIPTPPMEEPPPPDINEVAAQVQDIDERLTALEGSMARTQSARPPQKSSRK